ncbi:MAG: ECF transporter S component [Clostridiales bacterium]|nr:ECF transporter S component [Clostridiales bacterium]
MKHREIRNMTYAAMCLALGLVLPLLTGNIPQFGRMLSPMHIPALLCGFLCGWPYGLVVGFVMPLLRSLIFQMPAPLFPNALAMAFELAAYGVASALLYRALPRHIGHLYLALVASMLIGRAVWGLATAVLMAAAGNPFTWALFLAGAFVNAWPGIALHIVVIPPVVLALRKAKLLTDSTAEA